jgi:hypothetical protein
MSLDISRSLLAIAFAGSAMAAMAMGAAGCGNNGSSAGAEDGSVGVDGGSVDGGGGATDAHLSPEVFSGGGSGSCLGLGSACTGTGDCCSSACANGACAYPSCRSDNQSCSTNGECCSQTCGSGGTCTALNATCKTLGNGCAQSSECCSQLCSGGTCQPSSFCLQPGDSCAAGADCCTGTCTIASGQALGTCSTTPPAGPSNCGMVDGVTCGGSGPDGGAVYLEGGLPQCGGSCCSRACAPWGPTGVLVCQPASGCHPVGDLCTQDGDCCGANGIAGGSGKPVTCVITAPATVGVCRLPMGCKPNGDVCRLSMMQCSETCDCCSGNCHADTCLQDNVGVPRCAFEQCVNAGASCASSADCCNGAPCVPNPGGTPPYACYGAACVSACGPCTNNADCCPGASCSIPQGSTQGVCGPCGGAYGDGGIPYNDGGVTYAPDSGYTPDSGSACSLYGQICSTAANCCGGVPCTGGRCLYLVQ